MPVEKLVKKFAWFAQHRNLPFVYGIALTKQKMKVFK
jgi:hypothetical protein